MIRLFGVCCLYAVKPTPASTPLLGFQECRSKVLQNALLEHSAILLTCIKLPSVFKTLVLSIFEWPLKTGFTVFVDFVKSWFCNIVICVLSSFAIMSQERESWLFHLILLLSVALIVCGGLYFGVVIRLFGSWCHDLSLLHLMVIQNGRQTDPNIY